MAVLDYTTSQSSQLDHLHDVNLHEIKLPLQHENMTNSESVQRSNSFISLEKNVKRRNKADIRKNLDELKSLRLQQYIDDVKRVEAAKYEDKLETSSCASGNTSCLSLSSTASRNKSSGRLVNQKKHSSEKLLFSTDFGDEFKRSLTLEKNTNNRRAIEAADKLAKCKNLRSKNAARWENNSDRERKNLLKSHLDNVKRVESSPTISKKETMQCPKPQWRSASDLPTQRENFRNRREESQASLPLQRRHKRIDKNLRREKSLPSHDWCNESKDFEEMSLTSFVQKTIAEKDLSNNEACDNGAFSIWEIVLPKAA